MYICFRYVLSLQWKPSYGFSGNVTIWATVVMDYQTYWAGISSDTINVFSNYDDMDSTEIVRMKLSNSEEYREDDFIDNFSYEEDNDVLESVVATQMFVDFQKRYKHVLPLNNCENIFRS